MLFYRTKSQKIHQRIRAFVNREKSFEQIWENKIG